MTPQRVGELAILAIFGALAAGVVLIIIATAVRFAVAILPI